MFASSTDLALVAGAILAIGSLVPIISGLMDDEIPIVPLLVGMAGLGLVVFAFYQHRFDYSMQELVDVFRRVFGSLFRQFP